MKVDLYTIQARLMPAYITLLPLAIGIQTWLPEGAILEILGVVLVAPTLFAVLLAHLGRDRGFRLQNRLWSEWGGAPTTQLLRHRNPDVNSVRRQLYHKNIRRMFPDLHMPSPSEEATDPDAADQNYDVASRMLITMTRDRNKFPLVYKENVNYGFRRNLWGLRPYGLILSSIGFLICLVQLMISQHSMTVPESDFGSYLASIACLLMVGIWGLWINKSWVRIPAEAYADRLLETCTQLDPKKPDLPE